MRMSSRLPTSRPAGPRPAAVVRTIGAALMCGVLLSGCLFSESYRRGYILPEGALQQIPMGATQEQVLIVLGTPSTVATVSGEVFYYISQRTERPVAFMPQEIESQRVIAVYFDKDRRVRRIADYGLKDGKVFDYISRTTPTGGAEMSILTPIFSLFKAN